MSAPTSERQYNEGYDPEAVRAHLTSLAVCVGKKARQVTELKKTARRMLPLDGHHLRTVDELARCERTMKSAMEILERLSKTL